VKASGSYEFARGAFPKLYNVAHSEMTVDKSTFCFPSHLLKTLWALGTVIIGAFGVCSRHSSANNEKNTMKDAHNKAAEHHENAAKSHRAAADAHGKNDHTKGKDHSTQAQQHSQNARTHSQTAHEKSQQQK
jgi:hypothetical protein